MMRRLINGTKHIRHSLSVYFDTLLLKLFKGFGFGAKRQLSVNVRSCCILLMRVFTSIAVRILNPYIRTLQGHVPVTRCSLGPGWLWAHPELGSHSSDRTSLPELDGLSAMPVPRHTQSYF